MNACIRICSTHLLTTVTIAFTFGIGISPYVSQFLPFSTAILITVLLTIFCWFFNRTQKRGCLLLFMLLCVSGAGYIHGAVHLKTPASAHHIYNIIEKKTEAVLYGRLQKMPSDNGKIARAVIDISSLQLRGEKQRRPGQGLVQLSLRARWPEEILPGDFFLVRTAVKRPRSKATPGAFDYERFLAQKEIWITGFVRSPLFIRKTVQQATIFQRIKYLPERLRTITGTWFDKHLKPETAAAYRALLLGDRSRMDKRILEVFKASGTFHIIAISGLHMSVILFAIYSLFRFFLGLSERLLLYFSVKKLVAALTIPPLVCYAMLAGLNTPVIRAAIMSSVVLIAICSERKKSPAALVSLAALLILVFDPHQLFSVSFQLSFAAIIGILLIVPILKNIHVTDRQGGEPSFFGTIWRYLLSLCLVSIVATMFTAPFSITYFNRLSYIAPVANILIEPVVCLWTLPVGLLALLCLPIAPEFSTILLEAGHQGFGFATSLLERLVQIPFASTRLATPPAFLLFVPALLITVFSYYYDKREKPQKPLLLLAFAVFLAVGTVSFLTKKNHLPKVTFIDVGQGSSTLIESPHTKILIDGGGASFSDTFVGETVIAPFLWSRGIKRIDTIIITHPDADHYNGLAYIVEHFTPNEVWLRDRRGHDRQYRALIKSIQKRKLNTIIATKDNEIKDGSFTLKCLANLGPYQFKGTRTKNAANTGLILKACFEEFCFLFPGDINKEMEKFLLQKGIPIRAEVLLSAHHGSKNSNSRSFLSEIEPEVCIVSAAASRAQYFPHKSVLQRCQEMGIEVLTTAEQGTIEYSIDRDTVYLQTTEKFADNPLYPRRQKQSSIVLQKKEPTDRSGSY